MKRLFIIRKDLKLKPGKLAATIGHCCEAYFTSLLKSSLCDDNEFDTLLSYDPWRPSRPAVYKHPDVCRKAEEAFRAGEKHFKVRKQFPKNTVSVAVEIPKDVWNDYVNGAFAKTICGAENLGELKQAAEAARGLGLSEGVDWGYVDDTDPAGPAPENEDGTTTVGIWFRPLPDEVAREIGGKYPLYGD